MCYVVIVIGATFLSRMPSETFYFNVFGQVKKDVYSSSNRAFSNIDNRIYKRVEDEIITYEKVAEKEIMSEQEAYEEILAGEFKAFSVESVQSITIQNMEIEYRQDSKGFYVPVYKFDILLNGETSWIYIKAVK